jgi:regulator of RNase E activity RraA
MAIKPNPPLLGEEIIARAKNLSSALLADGMKGMRLEMDGCMEASIMPIDTSMKAVGTAITVETDNGDNFPIHVATYSGGEGYIMAIDGKGCTHTPYFGALISAAAKAVGYNGIVCDGLVRDRDDCIELGLPVFAKGFLQRGPVKKNQGNINESIRCGGIKVTPGDLIVGDCDGVTVVPRDLILQVLEKAEEKLAYEQQRVKDIAAYNEAKVAGKPLPKLAPQWVENLL